MALREENLRIINELGLRIENFNGMNQQQIRDRLRVLQMRRNIENRRILNRNKIWLPKRGN